jgi:hypothetical protein
LAAGEIGFETDTGKFKIGTGSAAWASLAYTAIPETIFASKGDILTATANDTPAILTAGSNGDTLVADSAATTGLRWQGNYAAGKNKIINGDFYINQRSFSSTTTDNAFGFDRWFLAANNGTTTYSTQTFTTGAAPVAGYEGKTYARIVTTGQTATDAVSMLRTRLEDVRTLAGQTATLSFWAKANTGTPKIATEIQQRFGTGGTPSSEVQTYGGQVTLSTSWARYSVTISIPSISGKTIGTDNNSHVGLNLFVSAGTDYNARTGSLGIQSNTFDIWGVQLEAGSVATAFQTATGTLQGELAACQRYYTRFTTTAGSFGYGMGSTFNTTDGYCVVALPVTMRTTPTLGTTGTPSNYRVYNGSNGFSNLTAIALQNGGYNQCLISFTSSALSTNTPVWLASDTGLNGYLEFRAEL